MFTSNALRRGLICSIAISQLVLVSNAFAEHRDPRDVPYANTPKPAASPEPAPEPWESQSPTVYNNFDGMHSSLQTVGSSVSDPSCRAYISSVRPEDLGDEKRELEMGLVAHTVNEWAVDAWDWVANLLPFGPAQKTHLEVAKRNDDRRAKIACIEDFSNKGYNLNSAVSSPGVTDNQTKIATGAPVQLGPSAAAPATDSSNGVY